MQPASAGGFAAILALGALACQLAQLPTAITAKGDSISNIGATEPPRKKLIGMGGKMPEPCLLQDECYGGGSGLVLPGWLSPRCRSGVSPEAVPRTASHSAKLVGDDGLEPPTFSV